MKWNIKELLLLKILFPMADKVAGTKVMKWYKFIQKMNLKSAPEITNWQNRELKKLVEHCYNNTKYYRRVFDELGIKPSDIKTEDDLKKLPIINKEIANRYFDEIVPRNINEIPFRLSKTGGTTGEPMLYYCDEDTWGYVTAAKILAWKNTGYYFGDKYVGLGSSSLFKDGKISLKKRVYNGMKAGVMLNGVNLTDEICQSYVNIIVKKKIKYLYGYAASLFILTKYVADNKIDLSQIEAVFTTSELLTDDYRELMEDTYKCRVMDCYGAKDAGISAYEIYPKQYQVGYNVIAEVINEIGEDTGTLLTTNLTNYSFPLLRYQFGDEATLIKDSKLYNGQLITKIIGRTNSVMRLENGHNLTATGFSMIMKEFDIVAFEIKKTGIMEVELKIQVVKDKFTLEQEEKIVKTIKNYIGKETKLNIIYIDEFVPLKNGKRQYFYN